MRDVVLLFALLLAMPRVARADDRSLSNLDLLIGVHNVVHIADMITTSYDLSRERRAREGNPMLRSFDRSPIALSAASGAFSLVEVWTLSKIRQRHPKLAVGLAAAMVLAECWAVTNNIRVAGQIQAARSGSRPSSGR